jgi:hypothetical protein
VVFFFRVGNADIKKCGGCKQMGHVCANCPKVVARREDGKCGVWRAARHCELRSGPHLVSEGDWHTRERPLLCGVVVPDHSCVTMDVYLANENAKKFAGRMYHQTHKFYCAFVVKPKEQLTSFPASTLHHLNINVREQLILAGARLISRTLRAWPSCAATSSPRPNNTTTSCCKPWTSPLTRVTRIGTTHATLQENLSETEGVRAMPWTWKPRSSRRTATRHGELLVPAFSISSLVFVFRTLHVMSNCFGVAFHVARR